jgi:hypothetical protein
MVANESPIGPTIKGYGGTQALAPERHGLGSFLCFSLSGGATLRLSLLEPDYA